MSIQTELVGKERSSLACLNGVNFDMDITFSASLGSYEHSMLVLAAKRAGTSVGAFVVAAAIEKAMSSMATEHSGLEEKIARFDPEKHSWNVAESGPVGAEVIL